MINTRHGFLKELHSIIDPKTYLEIGVQHGTSLELCGPRTLGIGIDPNPLYTPGSSNKFLVKATSDKYFKSINNGRAKIAPIDLAFIDGMHQYEYALRDFLNVKNYITKNGIIVFDDVLPRNQEEASRTQCPGDWTGDVWKVYTDLINRSSEITTILVDVKPTGLLVIINGHKVTDSVQDLAYIMPTEEVPVPESIITRSGAYEPDIALDMIKLWSK